MNEILEDLEFEELLVKLVNKTPKRFRDQQMSRSNILRRMKKITGLKRVDLVEVFDIYVKLGVLVLMQETVVEGKNGTFTARYYAIDLLFVSKMATRTGVKAKVGDIIGQDYIRPKG